MIKVAVDQIPSVRTDVQTMRENFDATMFDKKPVYNLSLEPDEANKIQNYLLGVHGRSASFSHNTVRMIYLSAVVQTTLGLGDLVPMKSFARGMVTVQAIFGIVLAGLLLMRALERARLRPTSPGNPTACDRSRAGEHVQPDN